MEFKQTEQTEQKNKEITELMKKYRIRLPKIKTFNMRAYTTRISEDVQRFFDRLDRQSKVYIEKREREEEQIKLLRKIAKNDGPIVKNVKIDNHGNGDITFSQDDNHIEKVDNRGFGNSLIGKSERSLIGKFFTWIKKLF